MNKYIITFFSIFCFINNASSQFQNIFVSNAYWPNEVSIMISHKNPNQVVIGSNILYFGLDTSLSGYYYSTNGGLNWTIGILRSNVARPSGDPVILVDTSGYFHYLQNSNYSVNPHWWDRELIMKSTNGGQTWPVGAAIGTDTATVQDKPWGCVDLSNSPYRNRIYVTWSRFSEYLEPGPSDSSIIMFSRSLNDAQYTWSEPVRISQLSGDARDSSNTVEGAVPCVGPNGEIYVSWSGPKIRNQQYGIFFDRSTDGGDTWLAEDIYITDQPGGWYVYIPGILRCNGFPVSGCDISSGPYRGNIYINWSDQRNGSNDIDIWFIRSTNGGLNWSPVKRVNDDPPGKNQFYSWMTVDQVTGYIYIIFYDQRSTSALFANVYIARSTNGGDSFENVKINTTPVSLYLWMFDYIGISAYNNKVRPVWMGNNYSIMTAIIDSFHSIGITNISSEVPDKFTLFQNYPNPFNSVTKIRFDIPTPHNPPEGGKYVGTISQAVRFVIYDVLGREVAVLVDEYLKPGTYEVEWPACRSSGAGRDATDYPSGVYFYTLTTGLYSETKKMVLLK